MRSHLKYTSEDYLQEADMRGVRPISYLDAQIIDIAISILDSEENPLADILERWKNDGDEKILDRIDSYRSTGSVPEVQVEETEDGFELAIFVDVKNFTFNIRQLINMSTADEYGDDRMIYYLVINKGPLPANSAWYEDTKISYYSKIERDRAVEELRDKLKKSNCKFI